MKRLTHPDGYIIIDDSNVTYPPLLTITRTTEEDIEQLDAYYRKSKPRVQSTVLTGQIIDKLTQYENTEVAEKKDMTPPSSLRGNWISSCIYGISQHDTLIFEHTCSECNETALTEKDSLKYFCPACGTQMNSI